MPLPACGPDAVPPMEDRRGVTLRIGELAHNSGVSVRSLRYYEEQGLLESERTTGAQRVYSPAAIDRVRLIQQLYAAGIPSRVVVDLLPCFSTGIATVSMVALMERERDSMAARLRELDDAHRRLEQVIAEVRRVGVAPDDWNDTATMSSRSATSSTRTPGPSITARQSQPTRSD